MAGEARGLRPLTRHALMESLRIMQSPRVRSIVEVATAAAMDALPQRLSVREMAAAAGVSLWSLQRAFAQASRLTPVAYVQYQCLEAARRELEAAASGATVFAIARRWGFSSPDGAFRDGYYASIASGRQIR